MTASTTPALRTARAIAPDVARGAMLLLIALANAPWLASDVPRGSALAHRTDADGLDLLWQTLSIVVIDARSYPLFAFLFGYGIWQLYRRQQEAGLDERAARALLLRRHAWMLAFGAVHALLLWWGDIIGAYGLVGLVFTATLLRRRDRTLVIVAAVLAMLLASGAVLGLFSAVTLQLFIAAGAVDPILFDPASAPGMFDPFALLATDSYLLSMLVRSAFWMVSTVGQLFAFAVPLAVLLGVLSARRGLLDDPAAHRDTLRWMAVGGIAVAWLGGAFTALQFAGLLPLDPVLDWGTQGLHALTGVVGGVGYAAAFGLWAIRLQRRGLGPLPRALTAVGRRSLTSYLLQSVIMVPLLSTWGFGLGRDIAPLALVALAVGTWLVSVLVALLLERAGRAGPAEWLLRRLADRRPSAA